MALEYFIKEYYSSYEVKSGSDITPCINIDTPLVVYKFCKILFSGNVIHEMTPILTLDMKIVSEYDQELSNS